MNARNLITILVLLFPAFALADASTARSETIFLTQKLVLLVFFLIGLVLTINGAYKLTLISQEGQKNAKTSSAMYVLAGALLMNITASLGLFSATIFDVDNACFIIGENGAVNGNCMSDATSGVTGELKTRIEKMSSGGAAEDFLRNIQIIIGVFQTVGLIYFGVGVFGLTQVSNGSAQNGYGKPIITMIASALIFGLPHTAQIAMNTLQNFGVSF